MSDDNSTNSSWKTQGGFIWALIGSAVGFANILSFSTQVYNNGGGAFLIPYFLALLILGIPLLILEGVIGCQKQSPLISAYGAACGPTGKIFGWLAVLACLTIGSFYIVLTGYAIAYAYFSAINAIPEDSKTFFVDVFIKTTADITEFGQISIPIFIATLIVAISTWFVLIRNVRNGIEKVCSIFMPLLAIIMTAFAIVSSFLPGGMEGWAFYLKPNFLKLTDPKLWRDVFGQLFFSLSLGLGIIVGYSRHTGKSTNIPRAMLYVALGDFAVSFISGAAIFACLAHISYTQNVPFNSILTTDSTFEIGFIIFPKIFKFFSPFIARIIGMIFFFCIFIAGITGLFSIVESIAGNIEIEYKVSRRRAVSITLIALTGMASLFCMGNAPYLINALEPMILGINMLIGGLALITIFHFFSKEIREDAIWKKNGHFRLYTICLRYVSPILLVIILVGNLSQEVQGLDLAKIVRWSWLILALLSAMVLTFFSKKKTKLANEMSCKLKSQLDF